jgi:hypothetical protein
LEHFCSTTLQRPTAFSPKRILQPPSPHANWCGSLSRLPDPVRSLVSPLVCHSGRATHLPLQLPPPDNTKRSTNRADNGDQLYPIPLSLTGGGSTSCPLLPTCRLHPDCSSRRHRPGSYRQQTQSELSGVPTLKLQHRNIASFAASPLFREDTHPLLPSARDPTGSKHLFANASIELSVCTSEKRYETNIRLVVEC